MARVGVNGREYVNVKQVCVSEDEILYMVIDGNTVDIEMKIQDRLRVEVYGNVGDSRIDNCVYVDGSVLNTQAGNCVSVGGVLKSILTGNRKPISKEDMKLILEREKKSLFSKHPKERRRNVLRIDGTVSALVVHALRNKSCEVYVNGFVQHLLCGNCVYIDGDVEMASANNIISYVG